MQSLKILRDIFIVTLPKKEIEIFEFDIVSFNEALTNYFYQNRMNDIIKKQLFLKIVLLVFTYVIMLR